MIAFGLQAPLTGDALDRPRKVNETQCMDTLTPAAVYRLIYQLDISTGYTEVPIGFIDFIY